MVLSITPSYTNDTSQHHQSLPISQLVKTRLFIVDIASVPERIQISQCACQTAGATDDLAPCVVLILYHNAARGVNQSNDVSLQVVQIVIRRALIIYDAWLALSVIEEVHPVAALNQMGHMPAVYRIVRRDARCGLSHSHAVVVVVVHDFRARLLHLQQFAARLPAVCPGSVVRQVAARIVRQGDSVVRRQLVLPCAVVSIGNRLLYRSYRAGGVGIPLLVQDVAATVIGIYPCCVLNGIVHPRQLAQAVIRLRYRTRITSAFSLLSSRSSGCPYFLRIHTYI